MTICDQRAGRRAEKVKSMVTSLMDSPLVVSASCIYSSIRSVYVLRPRTFRASDCSSIMVPSLVNHHYSRLSSETTHCYALLRILHSYYRIDTTTEGNNIQVLWYSG